MKEIEYVAASAVEEPWQAIIDVRSPGEFAIDHIPGAINLWVLSNEEHKEVGTLYTQSPFEARRLGAKYVTAHIAEHLEGALSQKSAGYAPLVYCARGGMRSASMARVLRSIGWRARVLEGGYKAFARFRRESFEKMIAKKQLIVLAGPTGTAKTRLLSVLEKKGACILDLEALACHKGSVLGGLESPQPSQKSFETALWKVLDTCRESACVFVEAESNRIGNRHCPPALWKALGKARVVDVCMPLAGRVSFLKEDYAHFLEDRRGLKIALNKLIALRGKKQVSQWHSQIDAGNWEEFLSSILANHYDRCYRMPGIAKSHYPSPECQVFLDNASQQELERAAERLLAFFCSVR